MFRLPDIDVFSSSSVLRTGYFPYGWIDGYLPDASYRVLETGFISPCSHSKASTLGKGKKRVLFTVPPAPQDLGAIDEAWSRFLVEIGSVEFRAQCLDLVRRLLPLETFSAGPYRDLFRLRQMLGPEDAEMQCEFSNLGPGVHLPPHSDSTDKLLTFVYYFAPVGWQDAWGGSTDVYRPRKPAQLVNFSNFFLQPDNVDRVERCAYRPNRLFFFAKNDRAWHGVAPISSDASLPRHTFNFSLRTKSDYRFKAEMETLQMIIRAAEQPAFA